jgi:hypothetical protein
MTTTRALLLAAWAVLAYVAVSLIVNPAEFARVVKPFFAHFIMLAVIALIAAFYAARLIRRGIRRNAAVASQGSTRKRKYRG